MEGSIKRDEDEMGDFLKIVLVIIAVLIGTILYGIVARVVEIYRSLKDGWSKR